mgnify:FL=1
MSHEWARMITKKKVEQRWVVGEDEPRMGTNDHEEEGR